MKYSFRNEELQIKKYIQDYPEYPPVPVFNYPVSVREGYRLLYQKKPLWIPTLGEFFYFAPSVIPDCVARGFVIEGKAFPEENWGGKDMFGIEWEYIPVAGGSMVRPGHELFEDANEWYEKIVWPDIESWDWESSAEINREFLDNGRANFLRFFNGCWYERLVSFMGFENAAIALIDEDQKDAVKELFDRITDLYCRIVDKCCECYDIMGFNVHDDWGSQRAPFFSFETGEEMIVPYMKKLTDHIHARGKIADLHSCGYVGNQIENFIAAGWDSWAPQPMNPVEEYYEKYGDQIVLEVIPPIFDVSNTSKAEQRAMAREFAEKYTKRGKPAKIGYYGTEVLTEDYSQELYEYSRKLLYTENA